MFLVDLKLFVLTRVKLNEKQKKKLHNDGDDLRIVLLLMALILCEYRIKETYIVMKMYSKVVK